MSLTVEEKIEKLKKKRWVIEPFMDASGNSKINAKFFESIGRSGKTRSLPLYNLYFRNRNDLVRELFYSSVGTQKDLAREYELSPEEVSYIKNKSQSYIRTSKDGEVIRQKINSGRRLKCSEDVRFHLIQIQTRPYNIFLRKETIQRTDWESRIDLICRLLTTRTGSHYYAEYITEADKNEVCRIYVGDAFPIYQAASANYPAAFAYLSSLFALTDNYKAADQRFILGTILDK